MQVDARSVVHRVLLAGTPGPEPPGGDAERQRGLRGENPVGVGRDDLALARCGQCGIRVAALGCDHGAPGVHRAAILQRRLDVGVGLAGEGEHLSREGNRELDDIGRAATGEHLHRFAHLVGVADRQSQRNVHVGEQRDRLRAGILAQLHHRLGQFATARLVLHERARAELHVEHEGRGPLRDLLRHDG